MPSDAPCLSLDAENATEVNSANLARVIHFVSVLDSKARFVLTLVLALTAYLVTELGSFFGAERTHLDSCGAAPTMFVLLDVVLVLCLGFFVATVLKVMEAVTPRVEPHSGNSSLLFFGTIASMPRDEFKQRMSGLTATQLTNELIDQTYDNAKVVARKATDVQRSIAYFKFALLMFGIFTLLRPLLLALVAR